MIVTNGLFAHEPLAIVLQSLRRVVVEKSLIPWNMALYMRLATPTEGKLKG